MSSDRIGLDQVLVTRKVDEAELAAVAFSRATAVERWRRTGRTSASSSPGPGPLDSRCSLRHARTSSCSVITWSNAESRRRRLIDAWRRYARHVDPRTTTIYDRRRENFDRHAAYVVVAFVAGA